MKVALLSFHNAYNFGACLQAYALQEAISQRGVDCEYVNYVNKTRKEEYDMLAQISREAKKHNYIRVSKLICGIPFMVGRKKGFEKFYKQHLRKTSTVYRTSEEVKVLTPKYDKFIVGSDQVWNPENNGSDTAFLLDFVEDGKKRISYSSSFGTRNIPEELKEAYGDNLKKFNRLAVREVAGINLVKDLSGRDAHLVLDPVLLLDQEDWKKMAKHNSSGEKYIFFYTNRDEQINRFLATGFPHSDLKYHILSSHVGVSDFVSRKKKVMFSMPPEAFLGEIMDAKLVVTASFHCIAFAIIFEKPFVAILTGDKGKDERIISLLRITGLDDRILKRTQSVEDIQKGIDYSAVREKLKQYRKNSFDYLLRAINDEEDIDFSHNTIPEDITENRFCSSDACTGCGACVAICPVSALSFVADNEGFLRPEVDERICTHCGECHIKCQVFQTREKDAFKQKYYGIKNTEKIRQKSSSGGAFRAIAEQIIDMKGVVCAASMDNDFHVSHKFVTVKEGLLHMQRTFYVQSDTENVLKPIEEFLKAGKHVLFVGTPCQVEGLKLFLGKDYSKLMTIDIICHGVPSQMVFSKFIEYLQERGALSDFRFRDKEFGWSGYTISAVINGKKYSNKLWLESFNKMFSHNLINRPSCALCKFANYNRPGDITIGDFWGLEKVDKDFYDDLGVSLVIINNKKGGQILQKITIDSVREYRKNETTQNSLVKPSPINKNRYAAFEELQKNGYKAMAKKHGEVNGVGTAKYLLRKVLFR